MILITITEEEFNWLKELAIRGCDCQIDSESDASEREWRDCRHTAGLIQPLGRQNMVQPPLKSKKV